MTLDALQTVSDRLDIQQVLARYCRAIDRCDKELLTTVYWPDAVDNHGIFNGNAIAFADFIVPMLSGMRCTMHRIGNVYIELDGDVARVETYVDAYHHAGDDSAGWTDIIVAGRYLDRFERRGGEWRIAWRQFVMDWNQNLPSTCRWDGPMFGALDVRGTHDRDDPAYAFFANRPSPDR